MNEKVKTEGNLKPDTKKGDKVGAKSKTSKKKKRKRLVTHGRAYILATYNNTIITFTDSGGDVLAQSSAGRVGFKGPKKATPYAAGVIVRDAAEKLSDYGLKYVDVFVRGVGSGREAAVRALGINNLVVMSIKDITPIPHNGPRPRKPRRV
ncbi:30S ribosomal protein S11 [Patescibacteria group bacterium]